MKKHHHFERRNTKAILISALAAATVVSFTGCSENEPATSLQALTAQTFLTESTTQTELISIHTTQPESTSAATTAPIQTEQTMPSETMESEKPSPAIRTERAEEYEEIPYDTRYEYSDLYYSGTLSVKQSGKKGTLLRVTVTTYENDVALDAAVTETVVTEPREKIVIVGTKEPTTQEYLTFTQDVIPYETEMQKDSSRYDDERIVLRQGSDGYTELTYLVTYHKGVEVSRELVSETIFDAQNEIVSVGTKPAWTEAQEIERADILAYQTEYLYDNTLAEGKRIVKTAGKDGYTENVYTVRYYRGELSARELTQSTVYAPTTEVIVIGTKKEESFGLPFLANKGYHLSQDYGNGHYAMDFAVWYGDPILAVKGGTVIYAYDEGDFPKSDPNWTYGTFVVIEHENGVRSLYAHLKSRTVSAGQKVSGGQTIGYSGNTGRVNPTPTASNPLAGTHLHFEIRVKRNGSYVKVDPKDYIPYR